MRTHYCVLIALFLVLPLGVATAQEPPCGDVNGDGLVDIVDVLDYLEYLGGNREIDTANGDIDYRIGTSISDVWYLLNIWEKGRTPGDCNPTEEYSFTSNETDTVYLPYRTGIANNVTEVYLPIAMTYDGYGGDFYWPLLLQAPGSNGTFQWGQTHMLDFGQPVLLGMGGSPIGDTLVLLGVNFFGSFEGNNILYSLRYDRVAPGAGEIAIAPTDRYDPLKFAVGRNVSHMDVDLFRPVVVEVDVSFPMGDCNCSGSLDISDLVCMVDYMFGFGSVCEPYLQPYSIHILDMGCSGGGSVDISDLVYVVDYMFRGGPPPCDPFAP